MDYMVKAENFKLVISGPHDLIPKNAFCGRDKFLIKLESI